MQVWYPFLNVSSTVGQSLLHAKIAPSLMYMPSEALLQVFILWGSGDVYRIEKADEIEEPCGIPTMKSKGSEFCPLKQSLINLSFRKDLHHWTSSSANPRSLRIYVNLLWLMLLKKPWMSNRSRPVLSLACWAN